MKKTMLAILLISLLLLICSCASAGNRDAGKTTEVGKTTELTTVGITTDREPQETGTVTTEKPEKTTAVTTTEEPKNLPVITKDPNAGDFGPGVGF